MGALPLNFQYFVHDPKDRYMSHNVLLHVQRRFFVFLLERGPVGLCKTLGINCVLSLHLSSPNSQVTYSGSIDRRREVRALGIYAMCCHTLGGGGDYPHLPAYVGIEGGIL